MRAFVIGLILLSGQFISDNLFAQDSQPAGINGLAGLWYDPAQEGEGFNITTTPAGSVIFFYGYTAAGERLWLISEVLAEAITFREQLDLLIYQGNGGYFHDPAPSAEALSDWGRLRITFTSCDEAQFELDGLDGLKASNQTKLAGITNADCRELFDHQADNRDFLAWPQARNGMLMPSNQSNLHAQMADFLNERPAGEYQ